MPEKVLALAGGDENRHGKEQRRHSPRCRRSRGAGRWHCRRVEGALQAALGAPLIGRVV